MMKIDLKNKKVKIGGIIVGVVLAIVLVVCLVLAITSCATEEVTSSEVSSSNGKYKEFPYMQNEIPSYRDCTITEPLMMEGSSGGEVYYRLKNNQIMYNVAYEISDDDIGQLADTVVDFKKLMDDTSNNPPFVFLETPSKHETDNEIVKSGVVNLSNLNTDKMVKALNERNIDTIDTRDVFHKAEIPWKDIFYDTDHHWNTRTGLWTSEYLMNYIADKYDQTLYNKDLFNPNNFKVTTYNNFYRGFGGRYTSVEFAGKDDLDVIEPTYDTNFAYSLVSQGNLTSQRTGAFGDTLLDKSKLVDDGKTNAYDTFSCGNPKISIATNLTDNNNGKKLLFIRDSFGCVVLPFLALQFKEVVSIDPRYYDLDTVAKYVKNNKDFDFVIMTANSPNFSPKKTFNLGL